MTREEHNARAMLLDRWYDPVDHTYNMVGTQGDHRILDADTLEDIGNLASYFTSGLGNERRIMVLSREIGCDEG